MCRLNSVVDGSREIDCFEQELTCGSVFALSQVIMHSMCHLPELSCTKDFQIVVSHLLVDANDMPNECS